MVNLVLLLSLAVQASPEIVVTGRLGWNGIVVPDVSAPVELTVANLGPAQDVRVLLDWDAPAARHEIPVSLPPGARRRVAVSVRAPRRFPAKLRVSVVAKGRERAATELSCRALDPAARLVVFVGSGPAGDLPVPGVEVVRVTPDGLPGEREGYEAVDAVVWLEPAAGGIASDGRIDALAEWISCGGSFVVARSSAGGVTGTPLESLLPVRLRGTVDVDGLPGLGELAEVNEGPAGRGVVLGMEVRRGTVRAGQANLPLIVEARRDAGRVTVAGFDPAREPFAGWEGAPGVWARLLRPSNVPSAGSRNPKSIDALEGALAAVGSQDLSMVAARFPDLPAPSLDRLFLVLVVYMLVVGPLDYWLLRLLRRPGLGWLTFTVHVAGFAALILVMGGAFIEQPPYIRELAVEDRYPDTGFVRRRAVSALLSPQGGGYEVEGGRTVTTNFRFRSMFQEAGERGPAERVVHGPARVVHGWRIPRGATGLALVDRVASESSPLDFRVESIGDEAVTLRVTNRRDGPFENAMLLVSDELYAVGTLPPGERRVEAARIPGSAGLRLLPGSQHSGDLRIEYEGSEETLNARARHVLMRLSVSRYGGAGGWARELGTRGWEGAVLLAWSRPEEPIARIRPGPERRSLLLLTRVFREDVP